MLRNIIPGNLTRKQNAYWLNLKQAQREYTFRRQKTTAQRVVGEALREQVEGIPSRFQVKALRLKIC